MFKTETEIFVKTLHTSAVYVFQDYNDVTQFNSCIYRVVQKMLVFLLVSFKRLNQILSLIHI